METPEFIQTLPYYHVNTQQFTPEKRQSDTKTDHFIVDDLLDFPTDDVVVEGGPMVADTSTDSSTTAVDSSNSSSQCGGGVGGEFSLAGDKGCRSLFDTQLPNIQVPHEDLAEFEWLSNFMEESFSNEDLQKLQLISGFKAPQKYVRDSDTIRQTNNSKFNIDMTVPGKARTKRSRAVSCNWASQLQIISPVANNPSNYDSDIVPNSSGKKNLETIQSKKYNDKSLKNEDGRKCLHCATDKTPQWRSGPMGPKTLCNACGVRYKSGRLVPEYRPAASPTFVLTKHSNSHRKVLELQRQKVQKTQHHTQHFLNHQNIMLQMPNNDNYMIHQHMSHGYRQLI